MDQEIINEIKEVNMDTIKTVVKNINYMIKNPDQYTDMDFKKYYVTTEIIDTIDTLDIMLSDEDRLNPCMFKLGLEEDE